MTYIVESGDTIESVAKKFNISPSALMQLNSLSNSSRLKVGMIITIDPNADLAHFHPPLGIEYCPRLSRGSQGIAVEELQRRLYYYGFYQGRIDGRFDSRTEQALKDFQRNYNLWVSGVTDSDTWRALGIQCRHQQSTGCPTLRMGSRGSAISFLQSLLQRRGYYVVIDGIYGVGTKDAVSALQRDYGLPITGEVNQNVWDILGVTCVPVDNNNSGGTLPPYQPPSGGVLPPYQPPSGGVLPPYQPPSGGVLPPFQPPSGGVLPPYQPPANRPPTMNEPNLEGLNFNWEEIGDFRYVLTTNKYRYREGEPVDITFRKRNLTNEPIILRYPSSQLFDFYISDTSGIELWRWSRDQNFGSIGREIILAPDAAETIQIVWNQKTNNGYWIPAQTLTLWGTNTATGVSIPLNIEIY